MKQSQQRTHALAHFANARSCAVQEGALMCAASQTRARTHPSDRLRTHALKHFALTHFANVRSCATHSPRRSPLCQSRHRGAGMPRRTRARPRLARRTRRSELGPEGRSPSGWSPHSRRPAHCRPVLAVPQLWIRKSLPLPRTNSKWGGLGRFPHDFCRPTGFLQILKS